MVMVIVVCKSVLPTHWLSKRESGESKRYLSRYSEKWMD